MVPAMADCLLCGKDHPDEPPCRLLRTGQQLDKYTLGPAIGIGGIAAVYEAKHPVLNKTVAVKILHARYAKDVELSQRFVREARETAALGHPAFVAVHDAGTTTDGCAYIEMDRLEGRELYSMRRDVGPLAVEQVVWISISILDALTVLHGRGVIHRDLKTQNIYICPTPAGDQVKLLDLGFAKVEDELKLTSKDQILGTPFYISPEQYLNPSGVDGRADLFSLGVVMFELLVGDWPYTWTNKRDLLSKVMDGDLERHPIARRPGVPAWLDEIVARSLAFKKEDRFENAAAMKAALEQGPRAEKPGILKRLFGG